MVDGVCSPVLRALCDTGAQANLIGEDTTRLCKLKAKRTRQTIVGVSGEAQIVCTRRIVASILHATGKQLDISGEFLVVPNFDLGKFPSEASRRPSVPDHIISQLADPGFWETGPIEIIMGAAIMARISGSESLLVHGLRYQSSALGWYAFGNAESDVAVNVLRCGIVESKAEERVALERYGKQHAKKETRLATREEEECEQTFQSTHFRDRQGRYVVRIPFKGNIRELGSSREIALRRFYSLERRFERDPEFAERYIAEIQELQEKGYLAPAGTKGDRSGPVYYIPHHAVTQKFRVVYDASCLTDKGISLNEMQLVGKKLQVDLFYTLMRFRCFKVAVTADIRKMYMQVKIQEDQHDLQRIFWRPTKHEPVQEFCLTRVTFGMASATFCAVRAMHQCAIDNASRYPRALKPITEHFYMDDGLIGADSVEEAKIVCQEVKASLSEGGFELDKFRSNKKEAIAGMTGDEGEQMFQEGDMEVKVLGLGWNCRDDELFFRWKPQVVSWQWSKRIFLRELARVFDPHGFLEPAIVTGKILMAALHGVAKDWDKPLPENYQDRCSSWYAELGSLENIQIPRFVMFDKAEALYGFSDASEQAYGAVVYLRTSNSSEGEVFLVASKSRVPKVTSTIPRLELQAAELLTELMTDVSEALSWVDRPIFVFSDSMVVLHWLKSESTTLKTFVHNRVVEIKRRSIGWSWGHVSSGQNPADLVSRGVPAKELTSLELWWKGPVWLRTGSHPVANDCALTSRESLSYHKEFKRQNDWGTSRATAKVCVGVLRTDRKKNKEDSFGRLIEEASTLNKLLRISAWVMRLTTPFGFSMRKSKYLTIDEEKSALRYWIKKEQEYFYVQEIKALSNNDDLPPRSALKALNPFVDGEGLLRVGGRLEKSTVRNNAKHPVILPDVSRLAGLIIRQTHVNTLHGGRLVMMAQIRANYWITNLRRACKTLVGRCVDCIRHKKQAMEQLMGSLPRHRVEMCLPFERTGVDYAGPFEVRPAGLRSRVRLKSWIAVFKCMVTKAIHLELVEDLSARAFVNAFTRFSSLRGTCTELWSDNGTCFVGAEKELKSMLKAWQEVGSEDYDVIAALRVNWRFIPPAAPHQGGYWEAAVKGVKHHLRRVIGRQIYNSDQWRTLLAQISAVMNSVPLTPMSDDPEDLDYLTPGHFLTGRNMLQVIGRPQSETPRGDLDRFAHLQHANQMFWKRWHKEYLVEMQQRVKWTKQRPNLKIGDFVLIIDENTPPAVWRRGRVVQVFPGADGLVRSCKLRLPGKTRCTTRAIQKLVYLPMEETATVLFLRFTAWSSVNGGTVRE